MAEGGEICVHLRLAPRENNPPNSKLSKRLDMWLKVLDRYLPRLTNSPYVTHYTTAIAAIVGEQNHNGQRADTMIERVGRSGMRDCVYFNHVDFNR